MYWAHLLGYGSFLYAHWNRPNYFERIKACLLRIYALWAIVFLSWVYGGRNEFTVRLSWFLGDAILAFWAWWIVEAFQTLPPDGSFVVQLLTALFFELQ